MVLATNADADHELVDRSIQTGQILYVKNCASCHGINLEGQPNWRSPNGDGILPAPPHDATGHTWHHDNALLFEYTKFGEIIINEKCQTSQSGIYACGDVTTVPYKQIVISVGEGAKASLSSFEYLLTEGERLEALFGQKTSESMPMAA